jgi:membrane fusion protein, copper/silver efflux system
MTRRVLIASAMLVAFAGAAAGGFLVGRNDMAVPAQAQAAQPAAPAADRPVLYYRSPMGDPDYSSVPKKDTMGMDYIPVYDDEEQPPAPAAPPRAAPAAGPAARGKILYYRNPMGLPDTSPVPKKDSMGMDYVPVYAGDEPEDSGTIKVSVAKVQRLGVRTEAAALRPLVRTIRATGSIQPDERRLSVFSTRFEGWIEKLHVNATGQAVRRGDPLMDVYAPDLVAAQQEYALASRTMRSLAEAGPEARKGVAGLVDAAGRRLRNLGFTDAQFQMLGRKGPMQSVTLHAPADGIVLEKAAVEGMRFTPGEALYRMADLSTVWLIAEVFEQDLGAIREGVVAKASLVAYPGASFEGVVTFVYPTLARETRTTKVRIEMPNREHLLKTDMFATIEFSAPLAAGPVLAVPDSAVLDTGTRQAVLIDRGEGRFEPRAVDLGGHADGYVEVRDGLRAGEIVVVGANFLIDAESNMKAALRAFTAPTGDAPPAIPPPPATAPAPAAAPAAPAAHQGAHR